jgi:hypothetical protein
LESVLEKCLTASANNDGAAVILQTCTGSANQKWTFTGGTITAFGNKCLDVTKGVDQDGTKLQVWTCSANNANQQWYYSKWDNTVTWTGKGKCIDVAEGNQADGTLVSTFEWKGPISGCLTDRDLMGSDSTFVDSSLGLL